MAIITTPDNNEQSEAVTINPTPVNPAAPPSPELAALLGTPAAIPSDDKPGAPAVKGPAVTAEAPKTSNEDPAVIAAREAYKKAEQAAKDKKKAEAAAAKAAKAEQAAKDKAAKQAEKEAKAVERAAERAKQREAALAAIPVLAPVEPSPLTASVVKALDDDKVSVALKTAFSLENNSELGYKKLAERFGYSVVPLIEALVLEKVWPTKTPDEGGGAWAYKALYKAEKMNGTISWGHMVNRASERFTMLNPENIAKREAAKEAQRAKQKEEAAAQAAGIAGKAKVKPTTTSDGGFDISQLTDIDMFNLAKACILAMPDNMRDLLAMDAKIKEALKIDE